MLFWARPDDGEILLRVGADVHARDHAGATALHYARTSEKIRLLVAHGADVNALETPSNDTGGQRSSTPLQTALLLARLDGLARVRTLLDLKADPRKRDGDGRSTLCYCQTIQSFQLIQRYGLDFKERVPGGGTLLHNLLETSSVRESQPEEVAFLDFLLGLGLPINATDEQGRTMLHVAAKLTQTAADIALLLERGADKTIRDKKGKRPVDLVPRSSADIRRQLA